MQYKQILLTIFKKTIDKHENVWYIKGEEKIGTKIKKFKNPPESRLQLVHICFPKFLLTIYHKPTVNESEYKERRRYPMYSEAHQLAAAETGR